MAVLGGKTFGGVSPATPARNLDDGAAQDHHNLDTRFEDFRPVATDVQVASVSVSDPKTLYRFYRTSDGSFNSDLTTGWIARAADVDFVKGPLNDDTTERTYYTQESGAPRVVDVTGADRPMGIEAPTAPVTVTVTKADVYTEEDRANDIEWNLLGGMEGQIRNLVTAQVKWTGATEIYSLTQRTLANGFDPENPPEVVFGISGNGTELDDPDVFAWALDPQMQGFWLGTYFCVPVHAYGYFSDFSDVGSDFETAMALFYNPKTEEQLLTNAQIADLRAELEDRFNADDDYMRVQRATLNASVKAFNDLMLNATRTAREGAVDAFYTSSKVTTTIDSAKDAVAQALYNLAQGIYSTPAPEFGA